MEYKRLNFKMHAEHCFFLSNSALFKRGSLVHLLLGRWVMGSLIMYVTTLHDSVLNNSVWLVNCCFKVTIYYLFYFKVNL